MNNRILNQKFPNSASPIFQFHKPKPFLSPKFPSFSNFYLFRSLLLHQTSIIKVNRDMNTNKIVNPFGIESFDDDLVIEASLTRILPPALTLEHGIVALKDALQEFKLHPPSSSSGLTRFQLIDKLCTRKITLVGYSMGARIALYMALRFPGKIDGAVVISGSPGLKDETDRRIRAAKDDSRARTLIAFGLASFLENWYRGDLWRSFREHQCFKKMVTSRLEHDDIHGLAKALSDLSLGRQPSLWDDLEHCSIPLMFIVGEKDVKFKNISHEIFRKLGPTSNHEAVEVPNSGHAVHLENPLAVVRLVRQFLTKTSHLEN